MTFASIDIQGRQNLSEEIDVAQQLTFPTGGLTTLRDLEFFISNVKCPTNRKLTGLGCVSGKRHPFVESQLRFPSPLSQLERDELAMLLPRLPAIESGMRDEDLKVFEEEYMKLPDRPQWIPIVISHEQVLANDEAGRVIRGFHRRELTRLISTGEIAALHWSGVRVAEYHPDHSIQNSDAIKYLQWCTLIETPAIEFAPKQTKHRNPDSLMPDELRQMVEDDKILKRWQIAKKYNLHPRSVHGILGDSKIQKKRDATEAKNAAIAKEAAEAKSYMEADPFTRMSMPSPVKSKKY